MKIADYVEKVKKMDEGKRRQGIRDLLPHDPKLLVELMMERPCELFHCDTNGKEHIVGAMRRALENHIIRQINPDALWA